MKGQRVAKDRVRHRKEGCKIKGRVLEDKGQSVATYREEGCHR